MFAALLSQINQWRLFAVQSCRARADLTFFRKGESVEAILPRSGETRSSAPFLCTPRREIRIPESPDVAPHAPVFLGRLDEVG